MTENPYQAPAAISEVPDQQQPARDKPDGSIAYGVAVRILGLFSMVYGAWCAFFGFLYATGIPEVNEGDARLNFGGGMFLFLAGLMLTGFAPLIVRLSYPKSRFAEHV
jgi:hypothetical protein